MRPNSGVTSFEGRDLHRWRIHACSWAYYNYCIAKRDACRLATRRLTSFIKALGVISHTFSWNTSSLQVALCTFIIRPQWSTFKASRRFNGAIEMRHNSVQTQPQRDVAYDWDIFVGAPCCLLCNIVPFGFLTCFHLKKHFRHKGVKTIQYSAKTEQSPKH